MDFFSCNAEISDGDREPFAQTTDYICMCNQMVTSEIKK